MLNNLFANTISQPLDLHLLGVAKRTVEILESFGLDTKIVEQLKRPAYLSGLFHDIGKVDPSFQSFIKNKRNKNKTKESTDAEELRDVEEKSWHGVFHQEISWAYLARHISLETSLIGPSTKSTVEYAVYWHHPPSIDNKRDNTDDIFDAFNKDVNIDCFHGFMDNLLLQSTEKFTIDKYGNSNNLSTPLYHKGSGERMVETQAYMTLITGCLIEADREVSQWEPKRLHKYVLGGKEKLEHKKSKFSKLLKTNNERSKNQLNLAKKLSENIISICGVDTGAGKTRITLMWKSCLNSDRKLIIALPKRRQVEALYNTLESDIKQCFNSDLSVQAVHGGRVQLPEGLGDSVLPMDSDINVLVFDHLLHTFYRRGMFSQFIEVLRSDLVFDEYHEFIWLDKMIPSLSVVIKIRSWMSNGGKTLFLSGTPDPALNKFLFNKNNIDHSYFDRSYLNEVHKDVATYKFADTTNNSVLESDIETLFSFNRVKDAQQAFVRAKSPVSIMHSKFAEEDLKKNINTLLCNFKKDSKFNENVISALILQSSFDISLKNAKLTWSHPNTIAQFLGRKNRHGDKPNGTVTFFKDEDPIKSFAKNKAGFSDIYNKFLTHAEKLLVEPQIWTHREATIKLWDEFWTEETVELEFKELEERFKKSVEDMRKHFPKKVKPNKNARGGGIFRGTSAFVAAAKYDDNGLNQGMTSVDSPISVSAKWETEKLSNAMKNISKAKFKSAFEKTEFDTDMYLGTKPYNEIRHGKSAETPFYYSHIDSEIADSLKEVLTEDGKSYYTVYNSNVGLIEEGLFGEWINNKKEKK